MGRHASRTSTAHCNRGRVVVPGGDQGCLDRVSRCGRYDPEGQQQRVRCPVRGVTMPSRHPGALAKRSTAGTPATSRSPGCDTPPSIVHPWGMPRTVEGSRFTGRSRLIPWTAGKGTRLSQHVASDCVRSAYSAYGSRAGGAAGSAGSPAPGGSQKPGPTGGRSQERVVAGLSVRSDEKGR
jgi:hypothetical protein